SRELKAARVASDDERERLWPTGQRPLARWVASRNPSRSTSRRSRSRFEDRNESGARVVDQLQYVEVFDLGRDAINPRHHVDDLLREEGTGFLLVIPQVEVLCLAGIIEREALEAQAGHAVERSSGFVGNLRES